mgnify:CR=1 FL=1
MWIAAATSDRCATTLRAQATMRFSHGPSLRALGAAVRLVGLLRIVVAATSDRAVLVENIFTTIVESVQLRLSVEQLLVALRHERLKLSNHCGQALDFRVLRKDNLRSPRRVVRGNEILQVSVVRLVVIHS